MRQYIDGIRGEENNKNSIKLFNHNDETDRDNNQLAKRFLRHIDIDPRMIT